MPTAIFRRPIRPSWRLAASTPTRSLAAIHATRPDVDALVLERLLPDFDGIANPLLALPHFPSPNVSLAVSLDGGFEALLSRVSGKRKRKKHRSQTRKFEAAGGFRRIEASTPDEVLRLLDAFFAMKEFRFRKMGIANVFGDAEVQTFFRSLFMERCAKVRRLSCSTHWKSAARCAPLPDRAGRPSASSANSARSPRTILAMPAPATSCSSRTSARPAGKVWRSIDFSVGDEPYKRLWCDIETRHFDVVAPLTAKGALLARSLRLTAGVKACIKNSPTVWKLTKLLRRKAAGQPQPSED